jgi:hypothetical protein
LNFIDEEKQEFCDVCLKELSGAATFVDTFEEEEAMEETELCPVCGERYMAFGEKMCEECKKKSQYEDDDLQEDLDGDDESWRSYLDDDDQEEEDLGLSMDEEFAGEFDEEEEETEFEEGEEDEWEEVSADDYYDDDDDHDDDDDDDDDF